MTVQNGSTRITYPISPDYVKAWDAVRALAELISNSLDEDPSPKIAWKDGVFTIEDRSPGIPEYGLILGRSQKGGDQIGQWGEGLKIACLVLARTRAIKNLTVQTVGYTITPQIVKEAILPGSSERHEMLSYEIAPNSRKRGTLVTVEGVSEAMATKAKARFRTLTTSDYTPPSGAGRLLLDTPGMIYIGGVFVQERKKLIFGYDLSLAAHKQLQNRDRTVIDGYALQRSIGMIMEETADADAIEKLVKAALDGSLDSAERHFPYSPSPAYRKAITEVKSRVFGTQKLAVKDWGSTDEQLLDLRDRGWVIPETKIDEHHHQQLMRLLGAKGVSTLARNVDRQPTVVTDWVADSKLNPVERENLETAVALVRAFYGKNAVGEIEAYNETRYEKADDELHFGGFYQPASKKGKIGIHRKNLADLQKTLEVLIHEVAHRILHRSGEEYQDRTRVFERQLGDMAASLALQLHKLGAISTIAAESALKTDAEAEASAEKMARVPDLAARVIAGKRMKELGFKTIKAFRDETGLTHAMATALTSTKGRATNTVPDYLSVKAGCEVLDLDAATIWLSLLSAALCSHKRNRDGKLYGGGHWVNVTIVLDQLRSEGGYKAEIAKEIAQQFDGSVITEADGFDAASQYRWQARPSGNEEWLKPYQDLLKIELARLQGSEIVAAAPSN